MSPMRDDDPELLRLMTEALEQRERGVEPDIDSICADRGEYKGAVREALGLVDHLPGLQSASVTHDALAGRVLRDRYRILGRLGAGAMGVVYHAEDLELGRPVALKVLRSDFLAGAEAEARFTREAEVLAAIRHSAVVTIHDRGRTNEGSMFLVMELLEGRSASELLEEAAGRGGLARVENTAWLAKALGPGAAIDASYLRTAVTWARDLAGGLEAAHRAGVLHRDVKPSNVFVRSDGKPVLIDFGIAARSTDATLASGSGAIGTPAYMAPEQLQDDFESTAALDVYGLTATLYHMLTLKAPFSGTPSQVFSAMARREPVPAYRLREGLPRDLQAVLDHGMAHDPARRYASVADLRADLTAFLEYRPVGARPITALGRAWRRARRSTAFRASVTVAAVAVLTVGGNVWRQSWLEGRRSSRLDHWARLHPALGLWNPGHREIVDTSEHRQIARLLDSATAVCVDAVPTRSVRAAFRFDQGDRAGAAADMSAVAADVGTRYARALAERYRDLARSSAEGAALDTTELPEPTTVEGRYLHAWHLVRAARTGADFATARAALGHEALRDYVPAQEILLAMLVGSIERQPGRVERFELARDVYERAVRLEESLGRRTATTANLIGGALTGQERYDDALEILREGIGLCPTAHSLRINIGTAARRLGALSVAREHLEAAIEIRPGASKAYRTLAYVLMRQREFDRAQDVVEVAPFGESPRGVRRRLELEGEIAYWRALTMWSRGDTGGAREQALAAIEKFEPLHNEEQSERRELVMSRAIVAGSPQHAFAALSLLMAEEPSDWRGLQILRQMMPGELSAEETRAMATYIDSLIEHFAPPLEAETDRSSPSGH
ncbi:MAG: protein kinase [bacterium]|nr:protein kinase [bacterium]